MSQLQDIGTGESFRTTDGEYIRLEPIDWDKLRDNPDHWLHGINPQVERRKDVVYVMQTSPNYGVLSLMPPALEVEVFVPEVPVVLKDTGYSILIWDYRITAHPEIVLRAGGPTLEEVRKLLRALGLVYGAFRSSHFRVQVQDRYKEVWVRPDGQAMPENWDGFMNLETTVNIGSSRL